MDPKRQNKSSKSGETWLAGIALGAGLVVLAATVLPAMGVSAPAVRIDGMVGLLTGR
ncbi:MAG: hypothetical protein AAF390_16540 [Pseudomonadota bacterium]